MRVLSFGSLNIDYVYDVPHFIARGETMAALKLNTYSGGKGLNQSVALSKAGLEVYHAGAVGEEGLFLISELESAGVNTKYIARLKDIRTGHTIIQRNSDGDNCIILFGGANRQITKEQIDSTLEKFSKGDALVIQNEINDIEYMASRAHELGMIVAFNPSPMEEKIIPVFKHADYILLNEVEAGQFLRQDITSMSPEDIAKRLLNELPDSKIVLTLGTNGSVYADKNIMFRQSAIKVNAVDTTAAGDTFTGFFLSGIFGGQSPEWSMKFASHASAIAVTRPGAAPSVPTREEVLAKI